MANFSAMKKDDLVKLCTKLKRELKLKDNQEKRKKIDPSQFDEYALSYRAETKNGKTIYKAFVLKLDLDSDTFVIHKEIVESTKELALFKLEMSIIDYIDDQKKEVE